jgi:hypothetical protein
MEIKRNERNVSKCHNVTIYNVVYPYLVALISIVSSTYISATVQHKIVTVTLIFIHNMFRPYTAIIRCPRYA